MKANETKPTTLQYRATTSEAGYRHLEQALLQMGHLRNALIRHRDTLPIAHTDTPSPSSSRTPTSPTYTVTTQNSTPYSRRLLESVAREVNKSYSTYFKRPEVGRPQTASPYHNRTLEISEPANKHLKFSKKGWATVHVKGLPVIRFRTDQRLPANEQPKVIRITLKPRRASRFPDLPESSRRTIGAPDRESVGIDPGVKQNITAVSEDGTRFSKFLASTASPISR